MLDNRSISRSFCTLTKSLLEFFINQQRQALLKATAALIQKGIDWIIPRMHLSSTSDKNLFANLEQGNYRYEYSILEILVVSMI